jgi:peptide/nickel transport system substrate-binding protein
MMIRKFAAMAALATGLSMGLAGAAGAQELKIGLKTEPSSLDPYYHNLGPNLQMSAHIFDQLVAQDDNQKLIPALALNWKPISDTEWEFNLRKGVKFSDGSDFTAEDVVFSVDRVAKVPNSPSPFTIYTKPIKEIKVIDPHKIVIVTNVPHPLLPNDLGSIYIMSKKAASGSAAEGKTTEQLNKGEGLVGTGPYKFVEWVRGDHLTLEANPGWWGGKAKWKKVTFRTFTDNGARVAAILSGDVDVIESPPTADLPKLRENPKLSVSQGLSNRVIYIALDSFAEPSVGIPDTNGKNPLKDKRVREALSMAIDRDAIVKRIMQNLGVAAGDLLPQPMFGSRADAKVQKYDLAAAKKLLADAGYPNGFTITLGTPNDRYINDSDVAQAVASMWTRIGVKTNVDSIKSTVFFKNRDEYKYSAYLAGWGAGTGEMSSPLRSLVATQNKDKGMGVTNRGRYSNPAMDAKLEEALRTVDDKKREALLQDASRLVINDYGILPLHYEVTPWATKKGLTYKPRVDQNTLAENVVASGK